MVNQIFFKKDYKDAPAGTKLFLQDNMWYYKTPTEMDRWLTKEFVDAHPELFGLDTTVWEIWYHTKIQDIL